MSEQPYEKCAVQGAEHLSDKELLTILIRTGTKTERADEVALRLLNACGRDGLQALWNMNAKEFTRISGIGRVKAIQLLCVCELARRLAGGRRLLGKKLSSPEEIVNYYNIHFKYLQKEQLILLILDSRHCVIAEEVLSVGNIHSSIADPREIFLSALKKNGVFLILVHNHPSGDPTPSKADLKVTEQIVFAGKMLGIPLSDHIIIGQDSYISLRAETDIEF